MYALIASKMVTLIATMIRKNFPIVRPPADPTRGGRIRCQGTTMLDVRITDFRHVSRLAPAGR